MFAYCNNSPVAHADSQGTRCVPAGRHESAGRKYYNTADEAAKAFAEETHSSSKYIRHEYGTEIYSREINGKIKYTYSPPRVGSPHSVMVGYSTPPGTKYVAFAHTHPNLDDFSYEDKRLADRQKVNAYVVGPSGYLMRKDLFFEESICVGEIFSDPLSEFQRETLAAKYRESWEQHLTNGCGSGFACSSIWPTK